MAFHNSQPRVSRIPIRTRRSYLLSREQAGPLDEIDLDLDVIQCSCPCSCACGTCICSSSNGRDDQPWNPLQLSNPGWRGTRGRQFAVPLGHDTDSQGASLSALPDLTSNGDSYESEDELSINMDPEERGVRLSEAYHLDGYSTSSRDPEFTTADHLFNHYMFRQYTPFMAERQPSAVMDENPHIHFLDQSPYETEDELHDENYDHFLSSPDFNATAASTTTIDEDKDEGQFPMDLDGDLEIAADASLSTSLLVAAGSPQNQASDQSVSSLVSSIIASIYTGPSGVLPGVGEGLNDTRVSALAPFTVGRRPIEAKTMWLRLNE